MKKTILVVFILLMVSTPCLAEVEPDNLFSIEGTLWRNYLIGFDLSPTPLYLFFNNSILTGYYQNTVYYCYHLGEEEYCYKQPGSSYIDSPVLAVAFSPMYPGDPMRDPPQYMHIAFLQPSVFGISFFYRTCLHPYCGSYAGIFAAIGLMFKIDEDWTPPSE